MKRPDQSEITKTYQVIKNIIGLNAVPMTERVECDPKTGEYDIIIELWGNIFNSNSTPIKIKIRTVSDLHEDDPYYRIKRKKVYSCWFEYVVRNSDGSIDISQTQKSTQYIKQCNVLEEIAEQRTIVHHQKDSYVCIETDDSLFFLNKLTKLLGIFIHLFNPAILRPIVNKPTKNVEITTSIEPIDRFKKIREDIGNWIKQIAHPETCTEDYFEYIAIDDKVYKIYPQAVMNSGLNTTFNVTLVNSKTHVGETSWRESKTVTIKRLTKKLSD